MEISVLLGAPGSGKGTQAKELTRKGNFVHLSTGDILRENIRKETPLGEKAKQFMDKGELVPDELMISLIQDRFETLPPQTKVLLDGFPRTVNQAQSLDENPKSAVSMAIYFSIPEENLIERITGRRVAPKSGEVYHNKFRRPKVEGICDVSGEALVHRKDDKEDVVRHRLEVFWSQNQGLLDYYRGKGTLKEINADRAVENIQSDLEEIFNGSR